MDKGPKFMLCKNPLVKDDNTYILHARHPLLLTYVFVFEEENKMKVMRNQYSVTGTPTGVVLHDNKFHLLICKEGEYVTQESANGVMKRKCDWYKALLVSLK